MIYIIVILAIWYFIWFIIQLMIIKKDKIQIFEKVLDNTVFNVVIVIAWAVFILIFIPFSPQRLLFGESILLLGIIGQILVILGIINLVWLFIQKRGIGAQEMNRLLTRGAYSISRHPIYLSHMLIYFGLVFERGAFDALIISPIVIILYIMTAKIEEKYSIGKIFKEEYKIYRKRVPMFIKWWLFLIILVIFVIFLLTSFNLGFLKV